MYRRLNLTRLILIPGLICLLSFALVLPLGVTQTTAQGEIEPIPTEPIYEIPGEVLNQNRDAWNGDSDGRLDPHLDDAYNIYCIDDHINVWGGKPEPRLITSFPLADVLSLAPTLGVLSQDGVLVQRYEDDMIVFGSNGNTTPGFRQQILCAQRLHSGKWRDTRGARATTTASTEQSTVESGE